MSAEPVRGDGVISLQCGSVAESMADRVPDPVVAVELAEQEGLRFTSTVIGVDNVGIYIGAPVRYTGWVSRYMYE